MVILFLLYNKAENFVTNTEAINNIASLYNTGNLTANNINATGYFTIGAGTNKWGIIPFILGSGDSAQKMLSISPLKADGSMDADNNFILNGTYPTIWTNKHITASSVKTIDGGILIPTYFDDTATSGLEQWNIAYSKFKISDPIGTTKQIIFAKPRVTVCWSKLAANTITRISQQELMDTGQPLYNP
jgi:hypothetical protein